MSDTSSTPRLVKLPIKTVDDPEFSAVARRIVPPPRDAQKASQFFPAYAGFEIGQGSTVDISHFYSNASHAPRPAGFDRHLHSEELWIALEGDFYVPAAPSLQPDDVDETPSLERMHCFLIHQGDVFAFRRGVWHAGVWPVTPGAAVQFMMLLSGHRRTDDGRPMDNPGGRVRDAMIVPDFDAFSGA
jgi:mannose-6-phosphate isomerase-like protein (cupin superfamily)